MLALLERHKNTIGGLQHRWMKFMCRRMGLTEYILPRSIEAFELIGTKPVFVSHDNEDVIEIDPFFSALATIDKDLDQFVLSNIDKTNTSIIPAPLVVTGEQRSNGERVLSISVRSIALPSNKEEEKKNILLPTKIGKFRLRIEENITEPQDMKIAFFREIQGFEIERPPEGWDDLGAGGAFVQGRWAWAKERKSLIEASVAERTPFRSSSKGRRPINLIVKVLILIILSWVAVICTGLAILSFPLTIGRSFYRLLRIPENYIHDPLAFCIGASLFFPTVSLLTQSVNSVNESLFQRFRRWLSRFRRPPSRKLLVVLESFFPLDCFGTTSIWNIIRMCSCKVSEVVLERRSSPRLQVSCNILVHGFGGLEYMVISVIFQGFHSPVLEQRWEWNIGTSAQRRR